MTIGETGFPHNLARRGVRRPQQSGGSFRGYKVVVYGEEKILVGPVRSDSSAHSRQQSSTKRRDLDGERT